MYKYIIMVMKLLKFCPNCGKEINETAQFFEHCGNIISQNNAAQSHISIYLFFSGKKKEV